MYQSHFRNKSVLKDSDFSRQELSYLIDFALHLKTLNKNHRLHHCLENKSIALVFEQPSVRTRIAFTSAIQQLGGSSQYFSAADLPLGQKESLKDTAQIFSHMFDGLVFRGQSQDDVENLAKFASIPVWNGLTDIWHPTQMISDMMTIKAHFGKLAGLTLTFVGNGYNNMTNSLLVSASNLGINVQLLAPKDHFPSQVVQKQIQSNSQKQGGQVLLTDKKEELQPADVVYTDVWPIADRRQWSEKIALFEPFRLDEQLFQTIAKAKAIFMHCMPADHDAHNQKGRQFYQEESLQGIEVANSVFNGEQAVPFEQAENKIYGCQALLASILGDLFIPDAVIKGY